MNSPLQEKVLNSARQLFLTRGYRMTKMDDIARLAGMSKRTLYENFPSKNAVATEVVEQELKIFSTRMRSIIKSSDNPVEKLRSLSRFFMELPYPGITPVALIDLQRELPDLWAKVKNVEEKILSEMGHVIDEGKESGVFRADADTGVTITALTGAISNTMSPDFLLSTSLSLEEVYSNMFELITRGISSQNGGEPMVRAGDASGKGSHGA